jgi:type II secretory pathway pseudopilin PulG
VAIISLLIAVLLPALSKAKGLTQQALCASNLRQIGLAIASYNYSNQQQLTLSIRQEENLNWVRNILPYMGDNERKYACWDQGSVNTWCYPDAASQGRTVYRANRVFVCPANDVTHPGVPWGFWNETYWNSYAGNAQVFTWGTKDAVTGRLNPGLAVWPMPAYDPIGTPQNNWAAKAPFGSTNYAIVVEGPTAVCQDPVYMYLGNQDRIRGPLYHKLHNGTNNILIDGGRVVSYVFNATEDNAYWPTWAIINPVFTNPTW